MTDTHRQEADSTERLELREVAGATRRTVLQGLGAGTALSTIRAVKGHRGATQSTENSRIQRPHEKHLTCDDSVIGGKLTDYDRTGFRSDEHFHDTYTFDADEGSGIILVLNALERGIPYLFVVDPNGDIVTARIGWQPSLESGYTLQLRHRFEQTGGYKIIITSVSADRTFSYWLRLGCFPGEGPFECGDIVLGELTEDDDTGFRSDEHFHDTYTFDGEEGTVVDFVMYPSNGNARPYLYLLGPDGDIVAETGETGFGFDAFISHEIDQAGEYTLIATSAAPTTSFEYEISFSCDHPPAPPQEIQCGELIHAELRDADETGVRSDDHYHDEYRFEAEAGMGLDIYVEPWLDVMDDRPIDYPYVYLFAPEGEIVAEGGRSGAWFATVRHQTEQSGEYRIVVSSLEEDVTFEYGIWLRSCNSAIDALGCGDSVLGELTEDDRTGIRSDDHYQDTYVISLSAETRVTVIADVDPPDPEPYLYLLDDEGTIIAEDDHGFEDRAAIVHRVRSGGEYTAVVTSVEPGAVFGYRLRAYCDPWS